MSKKQGLEERLNKLLADSELGRYGVKARVINNVVHLQGVVDLFAEKEAAERIVRTEPEVKSVVNGITVCTDGGIDDEDVQFEVTEELRNDPNVPPSVGCEVLKGEVFLVGEVSSLAEGETALEAASRARGVRGVTSRLRVAEGLHRDEISLINRVKEEFFQHDPNLARAVEVDVQQGKVILHGTLNSQNDVELAEELVARVPGVKKVENNLRVKTETLSRTVIDMLDQISANPFLRNAPISYKWDDGQLVIEGEVYSQDQKKAFDKALHQVLEKNPREIPLVENRLRLVEE